MGGSGGGGGGGAGASRLESGLGGSGGKGGAPTFIQVEGKQRYGVSGGKGGDGGDGAHADGINETILGGSGHAGYAGQVVVVELDVLSLGIKIDISVGKCGRAGSGASGRFPGADGKVGNSGFVLLVPFASADQPS